MRSTGADPQRRRDDRPGRLFGPLHRPTMLISGVWLIYLVIPASVIFHEQPSAGMRVAGLSVLGVFALVYLFGFGRSEAWLAGRRDLLTAWTIILAVLVIAMIPFAGILALSMVTFVVASIAFTTRPRIAWPVGVALAGTAFTALLVVGRGQIPIVAAIGATLLGSFFVLVMGSIVARMEADDALRAQLSLAQERERIARDVHDVLGHSLTVINLKAELATRLAASTPERAAAEMREVAELSRTALAEARSTVMQVREASLREELAAARRALESAGVAVTAPEPSAANALAGTHAPLFAAVLREAVTNTMRHAQASTCTIVVEPKRLAVADDGRGFDAASRGNGLRGLEKRVADAHARLSVESSPAGTSVTVEAA